MENVSLLKTKIFADGADREGMLSLSKKTFVDGLTTNPSLMRKAGIKDYALFCKDILMEIRDKPISFEVFADDFSEMERQANLISGWGENVFVKIPVTNSHGHSSSDLVRRLSRAGVKVNVTAIMTEKQARELVGVLEPGVPSYISIFAGRIADTGVDPLPMMSKIVSMADEVGSIEVIWASTREVFNIVQASSIGCHVITVTADILGKLDFLGKNLEEFSLETVRMFLRDAEEVGYSL